MPSHRAHRRSDRNSRDCCHKPLLSPLRTATLRARNSKTRSGEGCLASFSCPYVNEELSYSRPRNFAQMRIKANGSTRKKHRMLRLRFLIVEVAATVLELADAGNAQRTAFRCREVDIPLMCRGVVENTGVASILRKRSRAGYLTLAVRNLKR